MVAQWGDLNGFPVFSLHGTPGSRFGRHYDESAYIEVGARVITYDRPGYGGSDRHRGRRVVDCVSDVALIADALGVERFAVTGGSGGSSRRPTGRSWPSRRARSRATDDHRGLPQRCVGHRRRHALHYQALGFDVGAIRIPTRIMSGLTDVLVPRQHGEWLARNVPNSEVVIDEEAGHVSDSARVSEHYRWLVEPT